MPACQFFKVKKKSILLKLFPVCSNYTQYLPAGEDAGRGEEDDGYWIGGTQQPVAVEGRRNLLSQLLAQRHLGGLGQLPAIGKNWAAEDSSPRGIQGPTSASESIDSPNEYFTHFKAKTHGIILTIKLFILKLLIQRGIWYNN